MQKQIENIQKKFEQNNKQSEKKDYSEEVKEKQESMEKLIDELKKIGCDTARSVLQLSEDELVRRTDLEEESIKEIRKILQSEFQDDKK